MSVVIWVVTHTPISLPLILQLRLLASLITISNYNIRSEPTAKNRRNMQPPRSSNYAQKNLIKWTLSIQCQYEESNQVECRESKTVA